MTDFVLVERADVRVLLDLFDDPATTASTDDLAALQRLTAAVAKPTCAECQGRRTVARSVTHPTNPNLDGWERVPCPKCS